MEGLVANLNCLYVEISAELIYYETENYEKAAVAFEQALKLENNLAARHVAYAKVQEKLGNDKLMLKELETAAELEPNKETLSLLHKGYLTNNMQAEADIIVDGKPGH